MPPLPQAWLTGDWWTLSQLYDSTGGQPGMYCWDAHMSAAGTALLVATRGYYTRFRATRNMTIGSIAFAVTSAATADDACDVGIYDAYMNRLASAGATTGRLNSTGAKTIPVAATPLTAGVIYYAAFSVGAVGGTAAQLQMTTTNGINSMLFGSANPFAEQGANTPGHPL